MTNLIQHYPDRIITKKKTTNKNEIKKQQLVEDLKNSRSYIIIKELGVFYLQSLSSQLVILTRCDVNDKDNVS